MLCDNYPWSQADVINMKYFVTSEKRFVPLICDEHLGYLFTKNIVARFSKIEMEVLQPKEWVKGNDVQK